MLLSTRAISLDTRPTSREKTWEVQWFGVSVFREGVHLLPPLEGAAKSLLSKTSLRMPGLQKPLEAGSPHSAVRVASELRPAPSQSNTPRCALARVWLKPQTDLLLETSWEKMICCRIPVSPVSSHSLVKLDL